MDNPWYIIGGLAIIAFLIAGPKIKKWAIQKGIEAGAKAGEKFAEHNIAKADELVPEMLSQIGATVVLGTSEQHAREIVTAAAAKKPKDYPDLSDGTFGIRYVKPTDTIVKLVPDTAGTRVQIEHFREHMGYPMIMPQWQQFRKNITDAATAAGVVSTAGPVLTYTRGALVEGNDAGWSRTS